MEQALLQVGLPVSCAWDVCETTGFVKPKCVDPTNGGWYKSRLARNNPRRRWYCPEHSANGRKFDDSFYRRFATPAPIIEAKETTTEEELYALLD